MLATDSPERCCPRCCSLEVVSDRWKVQVGIAPSLAGNGQSVTCERWHWRQARLSSEYYRLSGHTSENKLKIDKPPPWTSRLPTVSTTFAGVLTGGTLSRNSPWGNY
jgi:hypothetical protein